MYLSLDRIRSAISAGNDLAAQNAAEELQIEVILKVREDASVFADVLQILRSMDEVQTLLGQTLINIFQSSWNDVPASVLKEAQQFCEEQTANFVHAGAHLAMVEVAEGKWPGKR